MSARSAVVVLVALNIVVLGLNVSLTGVVSSLRAEKTGELARLGEGLEQLREERNALQQERARLDAERTRLDTRLSRLETVTRGFTNPDAVHSGGSGTDTGPSDPSPAFAQAENPMSPGAFYEQLALDGISDVPDPATTRLLGAEERDFLRHLGEETPRVDEGILISGDVERILSSPEWNSRRRELSDAERSDLARAVGHYRYYSKYSHVDRYYRYVKPEIAALREQGAYVDYRKDEDRPPVKDAIARHMEVLDEDRYRMYYLYPDDYPALDHHRKVEVERKRLSYLQIYYLLNDPETYALLKDL